MFIKKTILFFLLLAVGCPVPATGNSFGIKAQCAVYQAFVKSGKLPTGRQSVFAVGSKIFWTTEKMNYAIYFNYHKSFAAVPNGLLLYRNYKGYECGANLRRSLFAIPKINAHVGCGILLSGNYDRYLQIKQYMVYPTVGVEIFASHRFLKKNILPIDIGIPLLYSFREAGHYLNIGISLQIGICTP